MNSLALVSIAVFCLAGLGFGQTQVMNKMEAIKMVISAAHDCKVSSGASDDDMMRLRNQEITTPEGKCLGACIMKTVGVMSPEGKMVKDGFMMGVKMMFEGAPDKAKTAEEILDACADVTDPEVCEAAYKIGACLKKEKAAKGLQFGM